MANNQNSSATEEPKDFIIVGNGKYKIWWDEKEEIIRAVIIGEFDEQLRREYKEENRKLFEQFGSKVNALVDVSQVTKTTSYGRQIGTEVVQHPNVGDLAFVGASTFVRTVANFITRAAGKKNIKHFATEEEALKWLKKGE